MSRRASWSLALRVGGFYLLGCLVLLAGSRVVVRHVFGDLLPGRWLSASLGLLFVLLSAVAITVLVEHQYGQRLREAARFHSLVQQATDLVSVVDAAGIVRYASASVERLTGFPPADFLGQDGLAWIHPDDRPRLRRFLVSRLRRPGYGGTIAARFRRRDGSWLELEASVTNLLADPAVGGLVLNARDITERQQALARSQRQLAQLTTLNRIDHTILAGQDLPEMLAAVLEQVTAQLAVDAADVLVLDPAAQCLTHLADRGFHTTGIRQSRVALGEGLAGRALQEPARVQCIDLAAAGAAFSRAALVRAEGFVSAVVLPLISQGQPRGVLELFHRAPRAVEAEWLRFAQDLATQTAIAVDHGQLIRALNQAYDATLAGWSRALELRDLETEGHSQRVTALAVTLAERLGVREAERAHLRRGALLHDIGKMGIPDRILLKPGPLDDAERGVMQRHPVYAAALLAPIPFLAPALAIPRHHHERWDGGGYPDGLRGEAIPLAARIFAVVDAWDALTSDRPYRPAWSAGQARAYLQQQAGAQFDPAVVEAFLHLPAIRRTETLAAPDVLLVGDRR